MTIRTAMTGRTTINPAEAQPPGRRGPGSGCPPITTSSGAARSARRAVQEFLGALVERVSIRPGAGRRGT